MSIRAEYATSILRQFVASGPTTKKPQVPVVTQSQREANANRQRDAIHACLHRGEQPSGYRAEWIKNCAGMLVELLNESANDFAEEHPDDCITVGDLCDVLATTKGMINT